VGVLHHPYSTVSTNPVYLYRLATTPTSRSEVHYRRSPSVTLCYPQRLPVIAPRLRGNEKKDEASEHRTAGDTPRDLTVFTEKSKNFFEGSFTTLTKEDLRPLLLGDPSRDTAPQIRFRNTSDSLNHHLP